MTGTRPKSITVLSALLALTALGTAVFWALFFSGKIDATETEQDEAFEKAFPLADSWMISCSLLASVYLPGMSRKGVLAGSAAASALVFLGCMDILYSLENRKYFPVTADRAQMLVIHLWTVALGSWATVVLYKHRDKF
jgi:hypothetical protein